MSTLLPLSVRAPRPWDFLQNCIRAMRYWVLPRLYHPILIFVFHSVGTNVDPGIRKLQS